MNERLCLLALASVAIGCGASAPAPANPTGARSDDVSALERRIELLEGNLRAHEDTATTRFEALVKKLEELEIKLDETLRVAQERSRPAPIAPQPPRPVGPGPTTVYSVPVVGSPFEGPRHAKVTLVAVLEFTEPFSKRLLPVLDQLRNKYGKQLKIVTQHYVVHPRRGNPAALAVCAAGTMGRHRDMIDAVFAQYDRWVASDPRDPTLLDESAMFTLASGLGLRRQTFKRAYNKTCPKRIAQQAARFSRIGVRGVPTSFVNGRFVRGARPASHFETIIDEELALANKKIKAGTRLRNYYKSIVKSGATKATP